MRAHKPDRAMETRQIKISGNINSRSAIEGAMPLDGLLNVERKQGVPIFLYESTEKARKALYRAYDELDTESGDSVTDSFLYYDAGKAERGQG